MADDSDRLKGILARHARSMAKQVEDAKRGKEEAEARIRADEDARRLWEDVVQPRLHATIEQLNKETGPSGPKFILAEMKIRNKQKTAGRGDAIAEFSLTVDLHKVEVVVRQDGTINTRHIPPGGNASGDSIHVSDMDQHFIRKMAIDLLDRSVPKAD